MSGATEKAYQLIRSAIISGRFPAGSPVRETMLAEFVNASRTPVREAIRRLSAEGFVQVKAGAGAVVSEWNSKRIRDLAGIRAVLESHGAFLAATEATADQIRNLERMCDHMEMLLEHPDGDFIEAFSEANTKFHKEVLRASGNEQLAATASSLLELALIAETFRRFSPERIQRSCADHRTILEAIRRGEAQWAEATMRSHILASIPSATRHRPRSPGPTFSDPA